MRALAAAPVMNVTAHPMMTKMGYVAGSENLRAKVVSSSMFQVASVMTMKDNESTNISHQSFLIFHVDLSMFVKSTVLGLYVDAYRRAMICFAAREIDGRREFMVVLVRCGVYCKRFRYMGVHNFTWSVSIFFLSRSLES